ncbi:MAG: SpoIID/LytB domain-containing protein [Planctomycetes bacterium]|nr:SpoIID/LytB domain-containing protein [Planctomycetota bacterium]
MLRLNAFLPLVFSLIFAALMLSACMQPAAGRGESELLAPIPSYGAAPLIRVKLAKPSLAESVTVKAGKAAISLDGRRLESEQAIVLSQLDGAIDVGGLGTAASVEIAPAGRPAWFEVDGRVYRGKLRLVSVPGGWEVVNVVDLEQYVTGVIGWEMLAGWPVEALKAQAVASRTYALFEMEQNRGSGRNWDVDDTTQYQVYGGVGPADNPKQWRETPNVMAAREGTTGMVLTYEGKGFRAYFHSTSGGRTTDPITAFGLDESIEPLKGVDLGEFDKDSPKAEWSITMAASEVKARLLEKQISPHDLMRVETGRTSESGHAITLDLFDRTGHKKSVSAISFRQALGLFSTNFTAVKNGDQWEFNGKGYGHGCGMCQWSARGMAKAGWDSKRILQTMYPGAELTAIY